MYPKILAVCLFGITLGGVASAATHVVVEARVPRPDNVTKPALLTFMKAVTNPTIVLRVPAPQTLVTQAQGQQDSVDLGQGYLMIEKELVKAGFSVRDRGLLEQVLRSNQNLDYRAIQQKIDAQLILEIVSIQPRSYGNDAYVEANNHKEGRMKRGVFPISGWHFESRIVMVNTGEIGGIYSIDVAPAGGLHFLMYGDERVFNATPSGEPVRVSGRPLSGWNAGTAEEAAPAFVRLLVSSLIPTAARASLGLNLAPMTPEIIHQLGFKLPKNAKGVLVAGIVPNSRASASGLQLGDIIEQVNGRTVQSPEEVVAARGDVTDQPITLTVNRGGKTISITVPAP
jgi:hypothetical protein